MPIDIGINRLCSGVRGLGDNYIARIQQPDWRPLEHIETEGTLNILVDPLPLRTCSVCGQKWQAPRHTNTKICPGCKARRRVEMSERCLDKMRERAARRYQRKTGQDAG